jgi:hypothetical protein
MRNLTSKKEEWKKFYKFVGKEFCHRKIRIEGKTIIEFIMNGSLI